MMDKLELVFLFPIVCTYFGEFCGEPGIQRPGEGGISKYDKMRPYSGRIKTWHYSYDSRPTVIRCTE